MEINLEKRASKINGFGIFTENTIPKGVEYYKIPLNIIYSEPKPRCARIADNKYVFDDNVLNWVNHSCDPNSRLKINKESPVLVATREIAPDEEITVDYDRTEMLGLKVKCTCKSNNCRGRFNVS